MILTHSGRVVRIIVTEISDGSQYVSDCYDFGINRSQWDL